MRVSLGGAAFAPRALGVLAVVGGLVLVGCADDKLPEQPELPPVESMQAELSAMEAAPAQAKTDGAAGTGDYTNFANAWIRVKVVQLLGVGVILVPGLAMGAALAQEPTYTDGAWVWEVQAAGNTATLSVTGNLVHGWQAELRVTGGQLQDFLWVEGQFADQTAGSWTLHDPKLSGDDAVLDIDWTYTSAEDYSLEYTNVNQQSPDVGDTARYERANGTDTLEVTDASQPSVVAKISWDAETGSGSIEVPDYNDGQKACWGTDFKNVTCP